MRSWVLFGLAGLVLLGSAAAGVAGEPLKYGFKAGQTYVYAVTIATEFGAAKETSKGTIQFSVKSADAAKIQMIPTVNLTTPKPPAPGKKGPLVRPAGPKVASPRELIINPYGKVLKATGETVLPLLLGSAEELVIEPFSPRGGESWERERELNIRELETTFAFGPKKVATESKTVAREVTGLEITNRGERAVNIKKTYELKSAAPDGGDSRIQMQGTGELVFDPVAGVMKSGEFKATVVLTEKSITVRVPLTVTYRLLDAAEAAAARKQQDPKLAKALEGPKAASALKPIADADVTKAVADLKSAKNAVVRNAVERLGKAVPIDGRREEVAAELAAALKDATLRVQITKALKVWGTDKNVVPLLKHSEWLIRLDACKILADVGTKECLAALKAAQSDSMRAVALEAGKAIKAIKGRAN